MIDPATEWFEIKDTPGTKRAEILSNIALREKHNLLRSVQY